MKYSLNTKLLLSVSSLLVTLASNDMARGSDDGDMNHRVRQRAEDPQDAFLPDESTSKRAKNRKAPAEPAADVADEVVTVANADAGNARKRGRGDEDDAQTLTNQDQNPAVLKNAKADIVDDQPVTAEQIQEFVSQRLQERYWSVTRSGGTLCGTDLRLCDRPEHQAKLQEVLKDFPQTKFNRLVGWIEKDLEINGIDYYIELLTNFKILPADRLEQAIKWFPEFFDVKSDKDPSVEDLVRVIQFILGCSEEQLHIVRDWIVELGAQKIIRDGASEAIQFLTFAKEAPDYTLKRIAAWNKKANAFGRCCFSSSLVEILDRIPYCSDFVLNAVAEFLGYLPAGFQEDAYDYSQTPAVEVVEIRSLMDLIAKEQNRERIKAVLQWMRNFKQETGFVLSDPDEVTDPYLTELVKLLLSDDDNEGGLENKDHFLHEYPTLFGKFGILKKASNDNLKDICFLVQSAISGEFGDISSTLKCLHAMQSTGLLDMCESVGEVAQVLSARLHGPIEETIEFFAKLNMRQTCKTVDEVICKLRMYDALGIITTPQVVTMGEGARIFALFDQAVADPVKRKLLKSLPAKLKRVSGPLGAHCARIDVLEFVLTSGALEMCSNPKQLGSLIGFHKQGHSLASLTRVLQWAKLKDLKIMADDHIELFDVMLDPKDWVRSSAQSISKWARMLIRRGLMDRSFVEAILLNANEKGYYAAKSILEQDGQLDQRGPVSPSNSFTLYLLSHVHYRSNPTVATFVEDSIASPRHRVTILNDVVRLLGQDHPYSQQCLMLALGYDNQHDADGFLAIHQEMMRKRDEAVVHPVYTQTEGCELNLNLVKEPRPARTIHMPLNVWNRLFEQAKAIDQVELQGLIGDSSADNLWALQGEQVITDLLDPLDSLQATRGVSGYSQMLRTVLKNIQDTGNIHTFIQLLVNIQTCKTGKLNGIMHSHMFIAEDRVLDEGEIGTEAFKTNILDFFKEDLRRFREVCISHVVKALTGGCDPHDIYFVRGIIGGEVGLFLPNENPVVDFNAYVVKPALRAKTKQELLNLFYGYYSVEEVINRVHTKLNDGSIKVADANLGNNLTAKVIGAYLQDDAMDEDLEGYNQALVTADAEGKPSGLTPKAAEMLLKQLGILVERAPAKVYADPYELLFGE